MRIKRLITLLLCTFLMVGCSFGKNDEAVKEAPKGGKPFKYAMEEINAVVTIPAGFELVKEGPSASAYQYDYRYQYNGKDLDNITMSMTITRSAQSDYPDVDISAYFQTIDMETQKLAFEQVYGDTISWDIRGSNEKYATYIPEYRTKGNGDYVSVQYTITFENTTVENACFFITGSVMSKSPAAGLQVEDIKKANKIMKGIFESVKFN